jgi:hypothetical protein
MSAAPGDGVRNKQKESLRIYKVIKRKYGYDLIVPLTNGLSYEGLEKLKPVIETGLRAVIEMEWKRWEGCAYLKAATSEYDDKKKYEPVETSGPWELYCGETYFLEKLKADMTELSHILTAGSTGSGKSCCIFIIITNLLYFHDNVDLYLAQVSDKKDLQKFAHYKQTRYFAQNLQTTDQLIKYLLKLQNDRNKELNRYSLNNIGEYNAKFKSKAMNYAYLAIDEFASLMPGDSEKIDPDYTLKKRIIFNLHELMRQARSAGIFVITSLQRPDKSNLDPNIKNLLNIKIAFRANNIASSKVLTDDDSAYNLPNREALFMGSFQKTLKTPFINDSIIKELLKPKYEKNHKYVNIWPEPEASIVELPKDPKNEKVRELKKEKMKGKMQNGIDWGR